MAGTHGELFSEIGSLVVAAHGGEAIDLTAKSEELAIRYENLGVPADTLARAIARSLGAISVSLARAAEVGQGSPDIEEGAEAPGGADAADAVKSPATLFPSGVRLSLLS